MSGKASILTYSDQWTDGLTGWDRYDIKQDSKHRIVKFLTFKSIKIVSKFIYSIRHLDAYYHGKFEEKEKPEEHEMQRRLET